MQNKPILTLLLCTTFTIVGLIGGYLASSSKSSGDSAHAEESHNKKEDHSGHNHGDEHGHEESTTLSAQALKNLKVETKEIESSEYTTYRAITAIIEGTPKTVQPIVAPIGGIILSIDVKHGEMVSQGTSLMTLMRDSIPRAELSTISDLLGTEEKLKGLSSDEIVSLKNKSYKERQLFLRKNVLRKNGYWNERSELILKTLSKEINTLPYTVGLLGEISASGYFNKSFSEWIINDKDAQKEFYNVSSLLLDGKSISYIKNLMDKGGFESVVSVKVPKIALDYDIHELQVKIGDKVEMGQSLGILHNMRELHVEAHAQGSEIKLLMEALENDLDIAAVPLAEDSGIRLNGLKIQSVQDDSERGGAKVHIEIPNNPSFVKNGLLNKKYRSWKIRIGTRYMIRVPRKKYKDVFVIPSDAVVEDGAERIVFLEDGDTYKPAKVVVLFQNDEVAVLGESSDIFGGDAIVTHGAFGLGLALKAKTGGAVDAHAGHNH